MLNLAIERASSALPTLNHATVNKDSPDFCNRSIDNTEELYLGGMGVNPSVGFDAREKKEKRQKKEKYTSAKNDANKVKQKLRETDLGLGKAFQGADTLSNLSRYEAGIERTFYKALHELQRLKAQRSGEGGSIPLAVDIGVSTNS
jgi:hypothetical protein